MKDNGGRLGRCSFQLNGIGTMTLLRFALLRHIGQSSTNLSTAVRGRHSYTRTICRYRQTAVLVHENSSQGTMPSVVCPNTPTACTHMHTCMQYTPTCACMHACIHAPNMYTHMHTHNFYITRPTVMNHIPNTQTHTCTYCITCYMYSVCGTYLSST